MKKILFCIFSLILISTQAHADTPGRMAQAAEKFYEKGDYSQAIQIWGELNSLGINNGSIFNNIASAYWRQGKIGKAKQYFLKARVLEPRDSEIHKNIVFVQNKLGMEKKDEGLIGILKKIPLWRLSLNYGESVKFTAVLTLIIFGILFLGKRKGKIKVNWLLGILLLFWVFSTAQMVYQMSKRAYGLGGVVISPVSKLLPAPTFEAPPIGELKEGEFLEILKKRGKFALVKTPSGKEGWAYLKEIGEI